MVNMTLILLFGKSFLLFSFTFVFFSFFFFELYIITWITNLFFGFGKGSTYGIHEQSLRSEILYWGKTLCICGFKFNFSQCKSLLLHLLLLFDKLTIRRFKCKSFNILPKLFTVIVN